MREDLESHGEFLCKLDGTMEFTDFLILRSCVVRQVFRTCLDKKNKLRKEQHQLYLDKDWKAYSRHLNKFQQYYQQCLGERMIQACEWINYEFADYKKTIKAV